MAVPQIFILGISGYIGGQLAATIESKFPSCQITGLVRTPDQSRAITDRWPDIRTVVGSLDSHSLLVDEAAKADVVFQTADCDHTASVKSLIQGLSQGSRQGTYVQLSGSASIWDTSNGYGKKAARIYDDVEDIDEITSFDATHLHAVTDQAVISEGIAKGVKTAVLLPAMVYGEGSGPLKTKSMQLPWLVDAITKRGKAFTVGEGTNTFGTVHVSDLANALVAILEQALLPKGGNAATWGAKGIYYVEAGEVIFGEVVTEIAMKMFERKIITTADVDQLLPEEASEWHPYAAMVWGTNMRNRASRLRALGWEASAGTVVESISELLN